MTYPLWLILTLSGCTGGIIFALSGLWSAHLMARLTWLGYLTIALQVSGFSLFLWTEF